MHKLYNRILICLCLLLKLFSFWKHQCLGVTCQHVTHEVFGVVKVCASICFLHWQISYHLEEKHEAWVCNLPSEPGFILKGSINLSALFVYMEEYHLNGVRKVDANKDVARPMLMSWIPWKEKQKKKIHNFVSCLNQYIFFYLREDMTCYIITGTKYIVFPVGIWT